MSERPVDWDALCAAATRVGRCLQRLQGHRLVLAESCTSGLVAGSLGTVPGISKYFVGSAVVYRAEAKIGWLGVPASLLERHASESEYASLSLVRQVMLKSPSASVGVAVTGHLGPHAPTELDGTLWVAVAQRCAGESLEMPRGGHASAAQEVVRRSRAIQTVAYAPRRLKSKTRVDRLCEAAWHVLQVTTELLEAIDD